jgi:hypothetical protein
MSWYKDWRLWAGLVYVVALIAVGVYFQTERWSAISALATAIAGPVLFWYTVETQKLRKTAEDQMAAVLRPVVYVRPVRVDNGRWMIQITNIGSGHAFNVSLDPSRRRLFTATFHKLGILKKDEDQLVGCDLGFADENAQRIWEVKENRDAASDVSVFLTSTAPENRLDNVLIVARYKDLAGLAYITLCEVRLPLSAPYEFRNQFEGPLESNEVTTSKSLENRREL